VIVLAALWLSSVDVPPSSFSPLLCSENLVTVTKTYRDTRSSRYIQRRVRIYSEDLKNPHWYVRMILVLRLSLIHAGSKAWRLGFRFRYSDSQIGKRLADLTQVWVWRSRGAGEGWPKA
jgi:hypothetical protein